MKDKKVLTIQDVSCVGQCSLTVALPIISACGVETCVLPSAVLSTHTGGFSGYTFRDLTEDMPAISAHWTKEGIDFDVIYTGYLGSTKQIDYVIDIMNAHLVGGGMKIVDPAMADNGKLYYGFDAAFVERMKELCAKADIILPNITEAAFLTDMEYKPNGEYDEVYIRELLEKLATPENSYIVLTGVAYCEASLGVAVYEVKTKKIEYYFHNRIQKGCHGTGDVYASAFTGSVVKGKSIVEAAKLAADFTVAAIEKTVDDESHWYGVKFEKALPLLVKEVNS